MAVVALAMWAMRGEAAEPAAAPSEETTASAADLPGEVKPNLIYLKDAQGRLQPVPGFSFEELVEMLKLKHQAGRAQAKPRYTCQQLELSGAATKDKAELTIELEVALHEAGWIRVPLRLGSAVLVERPKYLGSGDHFLHFDGDQEGHVFWLRGEPESIHKLSLKFQTNLAHLGSETQLKLNVPQATTSLLKLEVPVAAADATAPEGASLTSSPGPKPDTTLLSLAGVGGQIELKWRPRGKPVAVVPTVLEATGALSVRINSRSVNTQARLSVRSFGGQFDRFRVRLPTHANLQRSDQPGVTIAPVSDQPASDAKQAKIVEVKLDKRTTGPLSVTLLTERPYNVGQSDELLELAGFEIVGAVRQWGNIAVQVDGDWQITWGPQQNVRQVDVLPEVLRSDDVRAGFEYFVQPCSLTAKIIEQKTRVHVEPQYLLLVNADSATLQATLKYTIRGAKVRALAVDLPGWQVDSIGPASLVDSDALLSEASSLVQLPLLQPLAGQFEITLEASRRVPSSAGLVEFALPAPQAATVAPADLVVSPNNNIELIPQPDAMTSLHSQVATPAIKVPEGRQQEPLIYRVETTPAKFVTALEVHPQAITAGVFSRVELTDQQIEVRQKLSFQVAYEAIDHIALDIPRSISLDTLTVSLDSQRLALTTERSDVEATGRKLLRARVGWARQRIGRFELELHYIVGQQRLLPAASVPLTIPLIMPAEGKLMQNRLQVSAENAIALSPLKSGWKVDEDSARLLARPGALSLVATQPTADVPLVMTLKELRTQQATVVEKAWIQTWLIGSARQDRALFRVTAGSSELRVILPRGASREDAQVLIDNKPRTARFDTAGRAVISLSTIGREPQRLVELRYRFTEPLAAGPLTLAPPQLEPRAWVRRLYWQLILPSREHLLLLPKEMISESTWTWDEYFWSRQPALTQTQLEQWIGSGRDWPLPAGANTYLFSTSGYTESLRCFSVQRSLLVFGASLGVLAFGLALIYLPRARHPAWLLAAAVLIVATTVVASDVALLFAQAASLGAVLAIVAAVLARRMPRPLPAPSSTQGSSRAIIDPSRTQHYYRAHPGTETSTATAPVGAHASAADEGP